METPTYRTYGIAIVLVLLVVIAGCSGPFQIGEASDQDTETSTATPHETTDAETETSDGVYVTTETEEEEEAEENEEEEDASITGRMLLAVDGSDRHVDASTTNESDGVWIDENETHRWHVANESTTLASALAAFGVEATADSLSYENETHDESTNGTTVAYRVDGTVVEDPANYRLEDDDEVYVTVYTSNLSVPGRHYSTDHPHAHGTFEATVEGEEVNFSNERYAMNEDYFHFHGDEGGSRWHAHSTNLTASYAISSFDDFDVTNGSVTVNDTIYDENRTTIAVNDEPVDPDEYVLKNGDDLELVVNETD